MGHRNHLKKNIIKTIIIFMITLLIFIVIIYCLKKIYVSDNCIKCTTYSEFANFIGGILNPLFTLLSTVAIVLLTYIISKNESEKAEKSIETQKRITINQMRQDALSRLSDKLNMFNYQFDKIKLTDEKLGSPIQKVLTYKLKDNQPEEVLVWLIILLELESFNEQIYLFDNLFKNEDFNKTFESIKDITSKLCKEQKDLKMITSSTLKEYIDIKQDIVSRIGNFIISEF